MVGISVLLLFIGLLLPAIPQPQYYHHFADQRTWLGIRNAADVLSNLPFAIAGFWGLSLLLFSSQNISFYDPRERWLWLCIAIGLVLVALGSGYYHLDPSNSRLVWDRLPMVIVFMSFVAAIIFDRINASLGFFLWPVLLVVGLLSVLQWYVSELHGAGDLRFYAGVQAYTFLVAIVMLLLPSHYDRSRDIAVIFIGYGFAKLFEMTYNQIYNFTGHLISGHSLKHLAAGLAGLWMIGMIWKRQNTD